MKTCHLRYKSCGIGQAAKSNHRMTRFDSDAGKVGWLDHIPANTKKRLLIVWRRVPDCVDINARGVIGLRIYGGRGAESKYSRRRYQSPF